MRVKKYLAANMTEAMKKIRAELGDEAVILNSKIAFTGGFLGLFRKKQIEVIAAIDPQSAIPQVKPKEKQGTFTPSARIEDVPAKNERYETNKLQREIFELKKMVGELTTKNNYGNSSFTHYPILIQEFLKRLEKQGIAPKYIQLIANELLLKWRSSHEDPNMTHVIEWGKEYLMVQLEAIPLGKGNGSKKYINLVGPTGVGKTTTLAKMGASSVLDEQQKIAFITTDTYRIAAIEQLKTYANLLNVPVEVVYNLDDFHHAIDKFKDYDLIFIDTAGRNYREFEYIEELKKVIDFKTEIETFLTLSLTMKEADIKEIVTSFQSIGIDKLIFTKIDETISYGSMFNIMMDYKIGAAYLTYGQDVPDDIEEATTEIIINHLLEDEQR